MSLNGGNNQHLEKYAEFVVGADLVSKVIFATDDKFYAVVNTEVSNSFLNFYHHRYIKMNNIFVNTTV